MPANQMPAIKVHSNVNIAVARDEAFCFYYEDNLLLLQEKGANIKYFSPIHDSKLPEDSNAILLGGGYPELYADKLGANTSMCEAIRTAFNNKMPIVAECGGFMYLHSEIIDKNGVSYPMADVIHASCSYIDKLVRFGYIEIKENHSNFLSQGSKIKGHEFHYYDSTYNGNDCTAIKPTTGKEYPCIIEGENYWLGFPHLYYPSNPDFVENFVRKARVWRGRY
jgi:cobyrinic acid a,c-diamide synthase